MKVPRVFLLFLFESLAFAGEGDKVDCSDILGKWRSEAIYAQLDSSQPGEWRGKIYDYPSKSCFSITQDGTCLLAPISCPKQLKDAAEFPYFKEKSFKKSISRFKKCLKKNDHDCLRGMVAKTIQLEFGFEPYVDRRLEFFRNLARDEYRKEMESLLAKMKVEDDTTRDQGFGAEIGPGMRGQFSFKDGSWLLVHYLGGD